MPSSFIKDPDSVLDYKIDWTDWLDTDTIATSSWVTDDAGITIDSDSETTTETTVWLSSGVAGSSYILTNTITTAVPRTAERSITIYVLER